MEPESSESEIEEDESIEVDHEEVKISVEPQVVTHPVISTTSHFSKNKKTKGMPQLEESANNLSNSD